MKTLGKTGKAELKPVTGNLLSQIEDEEIGKTKNDLKTNARQKHRKKNYILRLL